MIVLTLLLLELLDGNFEGYTEPLLISVVLSRFKNTCILVDIYSKTHCELHKNRKCDISNICKY